MSTTPETENDKLHRKLSKVQRTPKPTGANGEQPNRKARRANSAAGARQRGYTFANACAHPISTKYYAKGIAEPGTVTIVFGDSGDLKSFVTIDLGAHVASGIDWCGRRVHGTGVLVVLGEGQAGYAKRLHAWAKDRGIDPENVHLYVSPSPVDLSTGPGALAAAILEAEQALGCPVGLIVVDTYSTNLGDADEQSNSDAARALRSAQDAAGPERALVFVHHVGHTDKARERGAYQVRANAEYRFQIERSGGTITMTNLKAKEGAELAPMYFNFREVELGVDDDGDPITSLVIEPTTHTPAARRAASPPKGGNQRIVWDVLGELLRQSADLGKAGAPAHRPCITVESAIAGCRGRLAVEEKRQRERVMLAINGLTACGCLVMREGWLWCA